MLQVVNFYTLRVKLLLDASKYFQDAQIVKNFTEKFRNLLSAPKDLCNYGLETLIEVACGQNEDRVNV
jgi:hypothetical protein